MEIKIHSIHEDRECGHDVIKCTTTLSIDSTFTIPEVMRHKRIPERKIVEHIHNLLTMYLSKPIEIDEELLRQQGNQQS